MNKKSITDKARIIQLLCEGNSLRATSRIADCSINTVTKLLVEVGQACQRFHDETVRGLICKRVQCDEIWSFVYAKHKNAPEDMRERGEAGDVWTWVGIDAETKLVVSWFVGNRDADSANDFMQDVASRIQNRIQLTTDGFKSYIDAVADAFPSGIDYAQLVKLYGSTEIKGEKRYSPAECIGAKKVDVIGNPEASHISTSYVERQNLTMRMHMRRFTRLTNAFSKKVENHCHAIALHFVYYNFCKIHKTLRVTPAMEAGLTQDIMSYEDIARLSES